MVRKKKARGAGDGDIKGSAYSGDREERKDGRRAGGRDRGNGSTGSGIT